MAAIEFPFPATAGELYPPNPGTSGVTQYKFDGDKWNVVSPLVSLGTQNQGVFNNYKWPATDGAPGYQLTTDGTGNLLWDVTSAPHLKVLSLLEPFNGTRTSFTLLDPSTSTPFVPFPNTNLIVFLGGVPQTPTASYSVDPGTSNLVFTEAPKSGSTFYAITNVVV